MNIKSIILVLATLFSIATYADVLYLNNGNLVEGTIVENNATYITIRTSNNKELTYKQTEIRAINEEGKINMPSESKQRDYIDFSRQQKGWWCAAELTGGFDLNSIADDKQMGTLDLTFINGYRFNPYIRLGIGVGARYNFNYTALSEGKGSNIACPIFLDLRGNIISQEYHVVVPYWSIDAGYVIGQQAVQVQPTIGIRIGDLRNNVLVGLAYTGLYYTDISKYRNSICLKVAYEF